jgi:hypothetical protein
MWRFDQTILWIATALVLAPLYAADCCNSSVAVVASLTGSATVQSLGSREKTAISSLDWISSGSTLEVGARSRVVLILANGIRYELGPGARATITADAAPKIIGAAKELPALPPIPKPASILADSAPTSGAPRFRGGTDMSDHLYPRAGFVALANQVTLRFKAVPEAASYRVVLTNDGGDSLLNVTTESTEVSVPSGDIEAGARYVWRVLAMRSGVAIGIGMAEFITLPAENARQRMEFATAAGAASHDSSALALLAGVDLRLGLVAEACDELRAALKQTPEDAALRRALETCQSGRDGR